MRSIHTMYMFFLIITLLVLFQSTFVDAELPSFFAPASSEQGTPFIKVYPLSMNDPLQPLTIRWGGIESPQENDRIYMYLSELNQTVPLTPVSKREIGWFQVNECEGWRSGSCELSVKLYHPRDYAFFFEYATNVNYIAGQSKKKRYQVNQADVKVLAWSAGVGSSDIQQPHQLHLSLTHVSSEMRLMYTTCCSATDMYRDEFVQYALQPFSSFHVSEARVVRHHDNHNDHVDRVVPDGRVLVHEVKATVSPSYSIKDFPNEPANITTNYFHPGVFKEALMTGLGGDQTYYYRIVDAHGRVLSRNSYSVNSGGKGELSFVSSPDAATAVDASVDIYAFGDMGVAMDYYTEQEQQPASTQTVGGIERLLDRFRLQQRSTHTQPQRRHNRHMASDGSVTVRPVLVPSRTTTTTTTTTPSVTPTATVGHDNYFNLPTRHTNKRKPSSSLSRRRASVVMHIGDISYARGYAYIWEAFVHQIQGVTSQVPWMVSIGNHEYDYPLQKFKPSWSDYNNDSGGEAGVPYFTRFRMPDDYVSVTDTLKRQQTRSAVEVELDAHTHMLARTHSHTPQPQPQPQVSRGGGVTERNIAYSYEFGPVHFTVFSAEHDFTPGSTQHAFVVDDLAKVDRTRTPWVVLCSHRPLYCSNTGCSIASNAHDDKMDVYLRAVYQPLMLKFNVDIGLWGHVHTYERSCPMLGDYKCAPEGVQAPVHIVIGAAGSSYSKNWRPYLPKSPHADTSAGNHHQQPDWSVFRTMNFGFSHMRANHTSLQFTYYSSNRLTVHDSFELNK